MFKLRNLVGISGSCLTLLSVGLPASAVVESDGPAPAVSLETGWPDEGTGYPGYGDTTTATKPAQVPTDGWSVEVAQVGAGALGGAGVAFAGMFLYRRRNSALHAA